MKIKKGYKAGYTWLLWFWTYKEPKVICSKKIAEKRGYKDFYVVKNFRIFGYTYSWI